MAQRELSLNPAWMAHDYDTRIGMLHRFKVQIGEYNLGGWQKVSGLQVEFQTERIAQAGFNTYTVQLLKQPMWSDIELERALLHDDGEWELTYQYLSEALANPQQATGPLRPSSARTLTIQVNNAWGDPVRTLHFMNARPRKWQGPTLSAQSSTAVATEKITFIHEGFFADGRLEGGGAL